MQEEVVPEQTADSLSSRFENGEHSPAEKPAVNQILVIVFGLVLILSLALWGMHSLSQSDPYIQGVLQLSGDPARGREIFQLNCAVCHGLDVPGEVGPDLHDVSARKSPTALIRQVISGRTPPMPQFQPDERDMADLLAFLETL